MSWTVIIAPAAQRQMRKLERDVHSRVLHKLELLQENPRPPGVEKLSGHDDLYRVRVRDWRIIYQIRDRELIVLVLKVGNRRDVYR